MTGPVPLEALMQGHLIRTDSDRDAEVIGLVNSRKVRVAYLDNGGPFGMSRHTGEDAELGSEEIKALLRAVSSGAWHERVEVVLHHAPDSDGGPDEYTAETLSGVPNDAKISAGEGGSARGALNRLLGSLWLMGFRGTVQVSDGSRETFKRYEIHVSDEGEVDG